MKTGSVDETQTKDLVKVRKCKRVVWACVNFDVSYLRNQDSG